MLFLYILKKRIKLIIAITVLSMLIAITYVFFIALFILFLNKKVIIPKRGYKKHVLDKGKASRQHRRHQTGHNLQGNSSHE